MAHNPKTQPALNRSAVELSPDIVAKVFAICSVTGDDFDDVVADAIALHHDSLSETVRS